MTQPFGTSITVPNMAPSLKDVLLKFAAGNAPEIGQPIYYGDDVEEDVVFSLYDGDLSSVQTKYYDSTKPKPRVFISDPIKDLPDDIKEAAFENDKQTE